MKDAKIEKIKSHINTARVYLGNVPGSSNVIENLDEADRVLDAAIEGTMAKSAALPEAEAFLEDACHELEMMPGVTEPVHVEEGAPAPSNPHAIDPGVE